MSAVTASIRHIENLDELIRSTEEDITRAQGRLTELERVREYAVEVLALEEAEEAAAEEASKWSTSSTHEDCGLCQEAILGAIDHARATGSTGSEYTTTTANQGLHIGYATRVTPSLNSFLHPVAS